VKPEAPAEAPPDGLPLASAARRRFLAAAPLCCGAAAAIGLFRAPDAQAQPTPPAEWPSDVQALWKLAWAGVEARRVVDVHTHLLGHTAEEPSPDHAWIHPRTNSPFALGDWVRRRAIEHASGVASERERLSERYLERMGELWQPFPAGAAPMLLAFDQAVRADGSADRERTMFCTGDRYAQRVAHLRQWAWAASVHPARPDAIDRLQQAHAAGARVVKWLPSAMAIDPSDARHQRFYRTMAELGLTLLSHAGEEMAVTGAARYDWINPLLLRAPLEAGVRVIVAHCASLGEALDLDAPGKPKVSAFSLFARLMDDPSLGSRVWGDLSAITQINRRTDVLATLLERSDWHARLLWGSDYPLPAIGWLTSPQRLADNQLIDPAEVETLERLQRLNPVAFDFVLKRRLRRDKHTLPAAVFEGKPRLGLPS
jgi:uncharacterized protein